jgi:hypothetical protein
MKIVFHFHTRKDITRYRLQSSLGVDILRKQCVIFSSNKKASTMHFLQGESVMVKKREM